MPSAPDFGRPVCGTAGMTYQAFRSLQSSNETVQDNGVGVILRLDPNNTDLWPLRGPRDDSPTV